MNTKNNRKTRKILNLLIAFGLLVPMFGCVAPGNQPAANTAAPVNTATPQAAPTPDNSSNTTTENPASVFYGTWEKEEPGQPFRFEKFGVASKKDDVYVGKVTDQSNTVVANYTVYKDKTVEIAYLPAYYGGTAFTYSYAVSDGGNKLTLDGNPPIVYTKGSGNTQIQKDATILATAAWRSARDQTRMLAFTDAKQYDKGWNGNYLITVNGAPDEQGTFAITDAGKITLKPDSSGGSTEFTYKIKSDKFFDLTKIKDGSTDTWIQ